MNTVEGDEMAVSAWLERLMSRDRRAAERRRPHELVAHYWTGAEPRPQHVRDISASGVYLVTEDRWYPGTLMMLSLQRANAADSDPDRAITVRAQVVRAGSDGVALSLLIPAKPMPVAPDTFSAGADKKTVDRFLHRIREDLQYARASESGQALVEYILMIPLLFILIVNVINFGGFFFAWIGVSNAARAGADYAALGFDAAGSLSSPTGAQIKAVVTTDVASLPNSSTTNPVVNACQYSGTTVVKTLVGTCSSATSQQTDPESGSYNLVSVDVTYTYKPFIPAAFKFAGLNLYATIPSTTIHREANVRSME